ncbi:MAG: hypothetical protein SGILL_009822 [Bacillariaceae sp.]
MMGIRNTTNKRPCYWSSDAMGKAADACRRLYPLNFPQPSRNEDNTQEFEAAQKLRVEHFCTQLRQRGFAAVQLCPEGEDDNMPVLNISLENGADRIQTGSSETGMVTCKTYECNGKLTKYFPQVYEPAEPSSDDDDDDDDDDEGLFEQYSCSKCNMEERGVAVAREEGRCGPSEEFWCCETCDECWLCSNCYQDCVKFQEGPEETFLAILPPALSGIHRLLNLEPATKALLRSSLPDHGHKYIEGDKEIFHWSGKSSDQSSQERFGKEGDAGKLRSRLLGLGCDIISSIIQCEEGLKLPSPHMTVNGHRHNGFKWIYDEHGPKLSQDETENCEQWIYRGLACTNTSLLSAFQYFEKAGELHCEGHKDKGLLTIVMNPQGLEARDSDGNWIPMDTDEEGQPLNPNCAVVFPGLTFEKATGGFFRATEHRVRNLGDGGRLSLVAKLRCHEDTMIDVPWAVRMIKDDLPKDSHEIFKVGNMLETIIGEGKSVNNITSQSGCIALPIFKKPKRDIIFDDSTTIDPGLASLPLEALTQILSYVGVADLGRLACVTRWLSRMASHEYHWISAAQSARMDWITAVANHTGEEASVRWNAILGPRLILWETNRMLTLGLSLDYVDAFSNSDELTGDRVETIQVDQRTPLALVVANFVEKHYPDGGFQVHQGRPDDGYYDSKLQRVNLNLTAWHHQLSDGDVLIFDREDTMVD